MKQNNYELEATRYLFDKFASKYDIKIDCFTSEENSKAATFFSRNGEGLSKEWDKNFWCFPPIGKCTPDWVRKAHDEHTKHGVIGVMLLPAKTDSKWFHEYVVKKAKIIFLRGRPKLIDKSKTSLTFGELLKSPWPLMIVVFEEKLK